MSDPRQEKAIFRQAAWERKLVVVIGTGVSLKSRTAIIREAIAVDAGVAPDPNGRSSRLGFEGALG
jgi:hypothetical protein